MHLFLDIKSTASPESHCENDERFDLINGARIRSGPKYDSFIASASHNLQYDAVMQKFCHKNRANCCVAVFEMQQEDSAMQYFPNEHNFAALFPGKKNGQHKI